MRAQLKNNNLVLADYMHHSNLNDIDQVHDLYPDSNHKTDSEENSKPSLQILLQKLLTPFNKRSFLVFKHNKYTTIPTEKIAFFYVKYESSIIMSFDRQEYSVNYSLDQLQSLLSSNDYFRLNRQYLINFSAIKEVEHYFARKLLVNLGVPAPDKLLVSKEKAANFLNWLENR